MMEAIVSLDMPDNWITDIVEAYPSVIKIIDSKALQSEVRDLVQIEVENEEDLPKVIDQVRNNPNIFNVDISAIDKSKALAVFSTNQCMACRLLAGTECFLTTIHHHKGRAIELDHAGHSEEGAAGPHREP